MTKALVLGGGGTVGIAWETGVLSGLREAGVDVTGADLIVGTSAGSVVGAQLALGLPLEMMLATQLALSDPAQEQAITFDLSRFATVAQLLTQAPDVTDELLRQLGRIALESPTMPEADYLERFALLRLPWPARRLLVTAVEAEQGQFQVWDSAADAPLQAAVASSCAVPGLFPPVTIGGRRYMDGGMRSSTNADLARGHEAVLVITPIRPQAAGLGAAGRRLDQQVADLRAAGSRVAVIEPDEADWRELGVNLMDTSRRAEAAQVGQRHGRQAAGLIRDIWG
ncbi:MAG TPA: patatin-like phospholipase family protein [Roseiflexaceae bacterium]|nr:patatin-like phospholipase family protein [Roseiflexaceae bacterium]